jgi:hypothetical protein
LLLAPTLTTLEGVKKFGCFTSLRDWEYSERSHKAEKTGRFDVPGKEYASILSEEVCL